MMLVANGFDISSLPSDAEQFFTAQSSTTIPDPDGTGELICFGTDGGSQLCVRPLNGEVLSVPEAAGRVRHVNADLAAFGACLTDLVHTYRRFPELDDTAIDAEVDALRGRLIAVDPSVFSDPDDWWPVIIEQLADGLL